MTKMEIRLAKQTFMPGERLEGHVVIKTDKILECKKLRLILTGWAGYDLPTRLFHEDIVDSDIILTDGTTVLGSREAQFNFSFVLPVNAPPTYYGHKRSAFHPHKYGRYRASMGYQLTALADMSGILTDLREEEWIMVVQPSSSGQHPSSQSAEIEHKGTPLLRVEIGNDKLALGEQFPLRIWVGMKAKNVELEFIHKETRKSVGWKKPEQKSSYVCMARPNLEVDELPRGMWTDVVFETDADWPAAFNSEYIDANYAIRIATKTGWFGGKELEIPLKTTGGTIALYELDWLSFV